MPFHPTTIGQHVMLFCITALMGSVGCIEIFVSPKGSDSNPGSKALPLATCRAATVKVASLLTSQALSNETIYVSFMSGTYMFNESNRCCSDDTCQALVLSASESTPVVFRGTGDASEVNFDGSHQINTSGMGPVTNVSILPVLNTAARGSILQLVVTNPADRTALGSSPRLQWNGVPLLPSRWPDAGLGYVQQVVDPGAVYCQGRTKGPPPTYSREDPIGANLSLHQRPTGDWVAEYKLGGGFGFASANGYFANDWYSEAHNIVDVAQTSMNTTIKFEDYSRYEFCEAIVPTKGVACAGSAPGRFTVSGLLSEVSTAGEYFYDRVSHILYIYPPSSATTENSSTLLGVWNSATLFPITNSSWITVKGITISGIGSGPCVEIVGGYKNTIGGCTFHSSDAGVEIQGGQFHSVLGNDIFDISGDHLATSGDESSSAASLTPTLNLIQNNHITNVYLAPAPWSIAIRGLGDRFSHNLLHDSPKQLITPSGPLTMLDNNEIFNTGYVEGDGGVIYIGASLTSGFGMSFRQNFVHHSLDVPGLHGRGGIYFDDHEMGISNASFNVMYKAAGRAFLVNGGAGSNVTNNLIVNGGIGMYQQHADNADILQNLPLYDNGTLRRGDKGDYIWRTEQALNVDDFKSLFSTEFASRFPTFAKFLASNSTEEGWASAQSTNFANNIFLNNSVGNICFSVGYHPGDEVCDKNLSKFPESNNINTDGSLEGDWSWFSNAADLEFVNASLGFDTRNVGLYCDQWRKSMPSKALYRKWIKAEFEGIPSEATGPYTPDGAAARSSVRSGPKLVQQFNEPCPPLTRADCSGAWLAFGECQLDGTQIQRFTVEQVALAGGMACPYTEGTLRSSSCPNK